MIQDPAVELLEAVRRSGPSPTAVDQRGVTLIRRRFGLSLPPPFLSLLPTRDDLVVRPAVAVDGPAIAAVKWRAWRVAYRGLVPDPFLDDLEVDPPAGYWTARGMLSPSARHGLFVAGRPGVVVGVADVRPWRGEVTESASTSELCVLYVDPAMQRRGVGRALMATAVGFARESGSIELGLWVAEGNLGARRFYEAEGWQPDGARKHFALAPGVGLDEVRYRLPALERS